MPTGRTAQCLWLLARDVKAMTSEGPLRAEKRVHSHRGRGQTGAASRVRTSHLWRLRSPPPSCCDGCLSADVLLPRRPPCPAIRPNAASPGPHCERTADPCYPSQPDEGRAVTVIIVAIVQTRTRSPKRQRRSVVKQLPVTVSQLSPPGSPATAKPLTLHPTCLSHPTCLCLPLPHRVPGAQRAQGRGGTVLVFSDGLTLCLFDTLFQSRFTTPAPSTTPGSTFPR